MAAIDLQFVVSTGTERPDANLRTHIRSHVMLGKNRGKTYPLRKRKVDRGHAKSSTRLEAALENSSNPSDDLGVLLHNKSQSYADATIPRKLGPDTSTVSLADSLDPGSVDIVLQMSSIAKKLVFPLERCIFFDRRAEAWIAPLAVDPAYLHGMIFVAQYYFDAMRASVPTSIIHRTSSHLQKTLKILEERFQWGTDYERYSDSTIAVVMALAGHAYSTGNVKSAKHQIEGVHELIRLRGGIDTFRDNTKLLVEVLRCDIAIALYCGSQIVFFEGPLDRKAFMKFPDLRPFLDLRQSAMKDIRTESTTPLDIDDELIPIWRLMAEFCTMMNFAVDSDQRVTVKTFLETMASVMYRLVGMRFEVDSPDEAIRLGLIAFSSCILLQWRTLGIPYPHLASAFRNCLTNLTCPQVSSPLRLWLLMAGAVSVFGCFDDEWLHQMLRSCVSSCVMDSWTQVERLLMSFMWIPLIHDKPGKAIFEAVVRESSCVLPDPLPTNFTNAK